MRLLDASAMATRLSTVPQDDATLASTTAAAGEGAQPAEVGVFCGDKDGVATELRLDPKRIRPHRRDASRLAREEEDPVRAAARK
jgi:hypothetical protein